MKLVDTITAVIALTAVVLQAGCATIEDYDAFTPDELAAQVRVSDKFQLVRLRYDGQPWFSGLSRQAYISEFGALSYEEQRVFNQDLAKHVDVHCGDSLENLMSSVGALCKVPVADTVIVRKPEYIAALDRQIHPVVVMVGGKYWDINISGAGKNGLRTYCLQEGGTLIVSGGGPLFDKSFRKLVSEVFPDQVLKEVPPNHVVFQKPVSLPDGAPPLWSRAGEKLLGMEKDGRWFLFYHPGAINDAWKSGGTGLDTDTRGKAIALGVNIVSYALKNRYFIDPVAQPCRDSFPVSASPCIPRAATVSGVVCDFVQRQTLRSRQQLAGQPQSPADHQFQRRRSVVTSQGGNGPAVPGRKACDRSNHAMARCNRACSAFSRLP